MTAKCQGPAPAQNTPYTANDAATLRLQRRFCRKNHMASTSEQASASQAPHRLRSGCPAPSHSSSLHATLHSIPLHPIPSRLILHLRSIPSCAPFRPLSLFLPAARGSTRSSPFTPVPSFTRLRPPKLFIEKAEKCAVFFVFSFPRPVFVLQIRLFHSIPTHSLPTGLTNTQ